MVINNLKTWIGVFVLVIIEQGIKIIINNSLLGRTIPILPPWLYFEPIFNRDYSWFNSMLKLGIGKWIHIAIVITMILFIHLFYMFLYKQIGTNKGINIMYAFLLSGATCSLIDKVFWDGSLDYILVKGFFTFDLKDVYINVFIGLLILSSLLGNEVLKQIDDRSTLIEFTKYVLRKP